MKCLVGFFALGLLTISCSSSRITSSWKAETSEPKKYSKILVLGLIGDPDASIREKMEGHMAGDLRDLGYDAVTAIATYGPHAFEHMKEEEAIRQLTDAGIQAVITVVLLDEQKQGYFIPARRRHHIYFMDQPDRFWNYYSKTYGRVYEPGYYGVSTKYFWESNFYDLQDNSLVYSARSRSFDPLSPAQLGHEYGLMIVRDMVNKKVLSLSPAPTYKAF